MSGSAAPRLRTRGDRAGSPVDRLPHQLTTICVGAAVRCPAETSHEGDRQVPATQVECEGA
jgi:hypothetical protein